MNDEGYVRAHWNHVKYEPVPGGNFKLAWGKDGYQWQLVGKPYDRDRHFTVVAKFTRKLGE